MAQQVTIPQRGGGPQPQQTTARMKFYVDGRRCIECGGCEVACKNENNVPYGIARYGKEAARLYGVMDRRLSEVRYLAGDEYTIADIATYPWVARHEWHRVNLAEFANVKRWFDAIGARPAVSRGMAVPK